MSWLKFKSSRHNPDAGSSSRRSSIPLPFAGRFSRFKSRLSALIHSRKKPHISDTTQPVNPDRADANEPREDNNHATSELVAEPAAEIAETETAPVSKGGSSKTVVWNTFRTVLDIANEATDGIPPVGLKAAIGGLIAVIKTFEAAEENLEDLRTLTRHIEKLQQAVIDPLRKHSGDAMPHDTDFLENVAGTLEKELNSLATAAKDRIKQPKFKRLVGSASDAGAIRQMNQDIDNALARFQAATIVELANRLEMDAQRAFIAGSLPCAYDAGFNSGLRNISGSAKCLPGTQEATLGNVRDWLRDSSQETPPVFWIWGMAGTGKSTIAQTVAEQEATQNRLGASFFFSRDSQQQRNPLLLFSTIAMQLSGFNDAFKYHLTKVLKLHPGAGHVSIRDQFNTLLLDPLLACTSLLSPIVIVIDALDECEPESEAETIIETLATGAQRLGQHVKILITSRPEQYLRTTLQSTSVGPPSPTFKPYEINNDDLSKDIERYLGHHLQRIASKHGLPASWPDQKQRDVLVKKSGTLFIVAATLIKFIDDKHSDPATELDVLTKDNVTAALGPEDALISMYAAVIDRALPERTSPKSLRISERVKTIVGAIILIKDPMSLETLGAFLHPTSEEENISAALARLHSLLIVPDTRKNVTKFIQAPIRVLHQSFPEYLTNPLQCDPRVYIDPGKGHAQLAELCITHLMSLRANPCKLDNLAGRNNEVKNLKERIACHIPAHLRYSCLYFVDHIAASSLQDAGPLATSFAKFCESKLLAWIEVLSYLDRLDIARDALRDLQIWYADTPSPLDHIKEIVNDAQRLLHRFRDLIRQGAGQVYLTALPWTSPSTLWSRYEVLRNELQLPQYPTRDYTLEHLARHLKQCHDRSQEAAYATTYREMRKRHPDEGLSQWFVVDFDHTSRLEQDHHQPAVGYLTEAIALHRETLELRPSEHPSRDATVIDLAFCLHDLYRLTGDEEILQEGMGLHRATLERRPPGHPLRDKSLNALALWLLNRYKQTYDVSDLLAAIDLLREGAELRPFGHPKRPESLSNLAMSLSLQSDLFEPQYSSTNATVSKIVNMLKEATLPSLASIPDRIDAAYLWMQLARKHHDPSEFEAARVALDLLDLASSAPTKGPSSSRLEDEYTVLAQEVASDAAALAVGRGEIKLAVSLLERGQSSAFVGIERHRQALDEVREADENLARRFLQLSAELDALVAASGSTDCWPNHATRLLSYNRAHSEWVAAVEEIRKLPGLDSFMLSTPFHHLQQAAECGPVVIFNINRLRSDAIIVAYSGDPILVPLPGGRQTLEQLLEAPVQVSVHFIRSHSIPALKEIWREIVGPVVEQLRDYPIRSRLWLCPIGMASMLPLHAAGLYTAQANTTLRKQFVPSYAPSLGALIWARRSKAAHPPRETRMRSILGVSTCPGCAVEVEAIQKLVPNISSLRPPEATEVAVMERIREGRCNWLHLSGCKIPISPRDLQPKDVSPVELVVLSASDTAKNSGYQALRFIGRMMFAGFTNIIGPMWPRCNALGPELTAELYKLMLDGRNDYADAAALLEHASRAVVLAGSLADRIPEMANIVHYGV